MEGLVGRVLALVHLHLGLHRLRPDLRLGTAVLLGMPVGKKKFGQVSCPLLASHVIMMNLALLGAFLVHTYQKTNKIPAPRSQTLP